MEKEVKGEYCMNCDTFVEGFEYEMCCDGRMCGCLGRPIYPCLCDECWEEKMK